MVAIKLSNLKPFIAPLLMESSRKKLDRDLLKEVINEIQSAISSSTSRTRSVVATTAIERDSEISYQAIVYLETGEPAWTDLKLKDSVHQLVVVAVKGKYAAICASDGAMRDKVSRSSSALQRVPRAMVAKFIGPEARSLWLNGVHTPTSVKPDTKAMTGVSLEYAIDPIGDQSYYFSAVRSTPDVAGLKDGKSKSMPVGAAPAAGRVWVSRSQGWSDFKVRIAAIFNHATSNVASFDPFIALSKPVDSPKGVSGAYAISVVSPELLSEDDVPAEVLEEARLWSFHTTYEVTALADLSLRVEPYMDGESLGVLELTVSLVNGEASIVPNWKSKAKGKADECKRCERHLSDGERVKIYYDSGHTIAQGHCYEGGYSDQPFDWEYVDLTAYDVTKEKPEVPKGKTLASQIAQKGDNSLFAYVVNEMFLDGNGKPKGWLASDDGSMELADFIHVDPTEKVVTLVHIKASSNDKINRWASTADYEVVVSQAVKNLRHLDRRNLATELRKGKAKKIGSAVWHDGVRQADRNGFLKIVDALPASTRRVLVVFQPRVTEAEVKRCSGTTMTDARALRIKQINTMMLAARSSAINCGATFRGLTAK